MLRPLTEFDYHHTLAATPGISLVLFTSPTCGACRVAEQHLACAAAELGYTCFCVDVQEATGLARAFDIFHLPTLFLYRDGRFHALLSNPLTGASLRRAVNEALAGPPEEEP
jgi:thiol-disulfide isomerase/thioredoxin